MALGEITVADRAGKVPSAALFADRLSFAGEALYAAGGSAFKALFQAAVGAAREPLCVIAGDCGGYVPVYVPSTGRLKVFWANNDGNADGPLIEVTDSTVLSGVTFNLTVLSQ